MTNQWRKTYELADKIKALQPWRKFQDTDVFGFETPLTDEAAFFVYLGNAGA